MSIEENTHEENNPQADQSENSGDNAGSPEQNAEHDSADASAGEEAGDSEAAKLKSELAEMKDHYLRTAAELENVRRRSEKERSDLLKYGMEGFFKDLLPVLDSFDKALPEEVEQQENADQDQENGQSFKDGMVMVKRQLVQLLQKHGLEPVEAQGAVFDPNVHQAIQRVESAETDDEKVGTEFARGYTLNGRLLRPAMVSVLVPSK